MAKKDTVSWSRNKAGYDPGQRQSLKITFKKRNIHKVTLHIEFHAHSLGQDSYTSGQRWNHAYVYIYERKDNGKAGKLLKTHDWTYQIHGYGGSSSHEKDFSFGGVANGLTKLLVYYENKRVGTNNPWYGPKSTGKVEKTKLNEVLDIDDNVPVDVVYKTGITDGLSSEKVENLPKDKQIYKGSDYTVSSAIPTHPYYDFYGGYDKTDKWKTKDDGTERDVNTTAPTVKAGEKIKDVDKKLTLWACWQPKTFIYRYYPSMKDAEAQTNEYTDLRQSRVYKKPGVDVPDLTGTQYEKLGYKFIGWKHHMPAPQADAFHRIDVTDPNAEGHRECRRSADTYCFPVWESIEGNLTFNYGYYVGEGEERTVYTITESYMYGLEYNLIDACKDRTGKKRSQILARPGYKLVGWSYTEPKKIYEYGETTKDNYEFAYDYYGSVTPTDMPTEEFVEKGITLYAVWEYYSFMYVYTNEGRWRLVTPYVAKNIPEEIYYQYDDEVNDRVIPKEKIVWTSTIPTVFSNEDWRWPGRKTTEEPEPEPIPPSETQQYAMFDSESNILTFFLDEKGKYENGQQIESVTYYTGIEDTREGIPWVANKADIVQVVIKDKIIPYTTNNWFSDCIMLEEVINEDNIDFSIAYDVSEMFRGCESLEYIDFHYQSFAHVNYFQSMFEGCISMKSINMTGCTSPAAYDMHSMFKNCGNAVKIDPPYDTNNVVDMSGMFYGCAKVQSLKLQSFTTDKVTNMKEMFYGCSSLENISNTTVDHPHAFFTNFNTVSVEDMSSMFKNCESLKIIDLTSFNTMHVKYMDSMFEGCSLLVTIYAKRTNKNNVADYAGQFMKNSLQSSENMFLGCTTLTAMSKVSKKKELKEHDKKNDKSNYIKETDFSFVQKYDAEKLDATYANVAWVYEKETKNKKKNKDGKVIKKEKKDKDGKVVKKKKVDKNGKVVKDKNGKTVYVTVYEYTYIISNTVEAMAGYFTEL